jgi:hypothetical protein
MTSIALSLLLAAGVHAAPLAGSRPLPADTRLTGLFGKPTLQWWYDASPAGCGLLVDPASKPWFLCGKRYLAGLEYGANIGFDRRVDDAAWLDGGLVFVAVDDKLGVVPVKEHIKETKGKGIKFLATKVLGRFPMTGMKLSAGTGDVLYVIGRDTTTQKQDLYLVRKTGDGWSTRFLLATRAGVSAVAGDGTRTFVAIGPRIVEVGEKTTTPVLSPRPERAAEVTGLEYGPKLGLFYTTAKGVGYAGTHYHFQFLKTPDTQIRLSGTSLFVLLGGGRGVLKLDDLDTFGKVDNEMTASSKEAKP